MSCDALNLLIPDFYSGTMLSNVLRVLHLIYALIVLLLEVHSSIPRYRSGTMLPNATL